MRFGYSGLRGGLFRHWFEVPDDYRESWIDVTFLLEVVLEL